MIEHDKYQYETSAPFTQGVCLIPALNVRQSVTLVSYTEPNSVVIRWFSVAVYTANWCCGVKIVVTGGTCDTTALAGSDISFDCQ